MGPLGGYLNLDELNLKKANGGANDEIAILDKDGRLKTPNAYDAGSIEAGQYRFGGLPYFFKIANVRDILLYMVGLGGVKTYMVWRNVIYSTGYGETLIDNDRLRLAVSELEKPTNIPGHEPLESPENKMQIPHASEISLGNPRITVELLPMPFFGA